MSFFKTIAQIYEEKSKKLMYDRIRKLEEQPESATEEDKKWLQELFHQLCHALNYSDKSMWKCEWIVSKFADKTHHSSNKPYQIAIAGQNVITNTGAAEMLKIVCGISGARAFSNANAHIAVGDNTTVESASQTGIIATTNRFSKPMDASFPSVNGREAEFQSTFLENEANFAWNEFCITNANQTSSPVALNRRVQSLGVKSASTIYQIKAKVAIVDA